MAMGRSTRRLWTLVVVCGLVVVSFAVSGAQPGPSSDDRVVYLLPIVGTIDEGLAAFVQRTIKSASAHSAVALFIEINTFGGRVDSATEIRDALMGADVPVLAYVS